MLDKDFVFNDFIIFELIFGNNLFEKDILFLG